MSLHVSGGMFGAQSANEFCFTISSAYLRVSVDKYVVLLCGVCSVCVCSALRF